MQPAKSGKNNVVFWRSSEYDFAMNLQLKKPELEQYIEEQVKAGVFPTPEAVVEDALQRVMLEEVELTDEELADIQESRREFELGEVVDFKEFAARARKKYGIPDA